MTGWRVRSWCSDSTSQASRGTGWVGEWVSADLLYAAGFALVLGAAAGIASAWLITRARARGLVATRLDGFVAIGLVLIIYGTVEALDAYGLLAVFAAGFTFRRYEFEHELNRGVHHGAEAAGTTLELLVLLLLGSMLTIDGLAAPGVTGWLLAPILILAIRPALVFATALELLDAYLRGRTRRRRARRPAPQPCLERARDGHRRGAGEAGHQALADGGPQLRGRAHEATPSCSEIRDVALWRPFNRSIR